MENEVLGLLLINGTTMFVARHHVTEVFNMSLTVHFLRNVQGFFFAHRCLLLIEEKVG